MAQYRKTIYLNVLGTTTESETPPSVKVTAKFAMLNEKDQAILTKLETGLKILHESGNVYQFMNVCKDCDYTSNALLPWPLPFLKEPRVKEPQVKEPQVKEQTEKEQKTCGCGVIKLPKFAKLKKLIAVFKRR